MLHKKAANYLLFIGRSLKGGFNTRQLYTDIKAIFSSGYPLKIRVSLLRTYLSVWRRSFFFLGRKQFYNVNLLGFKVTTFNFGMFLFIFREIFIHQDYLFESTNQEPFILDCGANMGLASLYFKWKYPGAKILSFEPDEKIYELLCMNIANNKLEGVTTVRAAIGKEDGTSTFFSSTNSGSWNYGVGSIYPGRTGNMERITVPCIRLSGVIDKPVDFIKLDIEGAEYDVIEELSKSGKLNMISGFIIEYHCNIPGQEHKFADFLDLFKKHSFSCIWSGDPAPGDVISDILVRCNKQTTSL